MTQTDYWFAASDLGPNPIGFLLHDFNGAVGMAIAVKFVEKRKGGATLIAHHCVTEGDLVFTVKSRVPMNKWDRDALFGFMKDSLRLTETRGRKRKKTIEDVRAVLKRMPKASISRIALDLGVERATVRDLIKADGKTLGQLRRDVRENHGGKHPEPPRWQK